MLFNPMQGKQFDRLPANFCCLGKSCMTYSRSGRVIKILSVLLFGWDVSFLIVCFDKYVPHQCSGDGLRSNKKMKNEKHHQLQHHSTKSSTLIILNPRSQRVHFFWLVLFRNPNGRFSEFPNSLLQEFSLMEGPVNFPPTYRLVEGVIVAVRCCLFLAEGQCWSKYEKNISWFWDNKNRKKKSRGKMADDADVQPGQTCYDLERQPAWCDRVLHSKVSVQRKSSLVQRATRRMYKLI